jgi:hypothetical protein
MSGNVTHDLLNHVIDDVFRRKENHHRVFMKLRYIYMVLSTIVHVMNAISITTLAITFYGESIVMIVSASTSSVSTLLTTTINALRIRDRINNHHNSYVGYKALHDRFRLLSLKSDHNEEELHYLIHELNNCIGLILDRSEPISLTSRRFNLNHHIVCHDLSLAHIRDSDSTEQMYNKRKSSICDEENQFSPLSSAMITGKGTDAGH